MDRQRHTFAHFFDVNRYGQVAALKLDDGDVVYLTMLESPQRVKLAAAVGQRLAAFATASGKAMLAYLPDETVRRILERGMPQYTLHTLRSPEAFFENMRQVREQGFAVSEQEFEEGINAVAAPILDLCDRPIAAVAVAGPAYRLTRERMIEIGPLLVTTVREIAQEVEMAAHPEGCPAEDSPAAPEGGM